MIYPFSEIEQKWQKFWDEHETFKTPDDSSKQKLYVLDMFPYPSGTGLHVGHPEGYTATDIYCRFKRMCGFNVLHPMGWDAFGLPAERYAMQTGIHPRITTQQNIANFKRQIKMLGLSYDWSREINTTDPNYYKWTQWIFLKIFNSWYDYRVQKSRPISELIAEFERDGCSHIDCTLYCGNNDCCFNANGWNIMSWPEKQKVLKDFRLAYLAEMPVNWCAALGTVLANEEVDEWVEKGYTVERRMMKQWILRITAYAERLEKDLADLHWPNGIIEMQRNWIGKSEGADAEFALADSSKSVKIYTTRPDTMFGATYMVLSPEHPLVDDVTTSEHHKSVNDYREQAKLKSELERTALEKEKSGVFTGGYAVNPATKKEIPVWIADYVLISYGTGAIMAVPGHDERDYEFARKYKLPIAEVVKGGNTGNAPFVDDGVAVNSANDEVSLNGLSTPQAKEKIIAWLEKKGIGRRAVKYKLRDWLFSRQRYWGEPFPLIYLEDGTVKALPESSLPVVLPETESFKPTATGESPLAAVDSWVNTTDPETGTSARRETHTMPQWAGSCWYYLRYLDANNGKEFLSKSKEQNWMPIDLYVGGAEHAVLHLLYARFWHKVLYDLGYVTTKEPFKRLVNQGTILGEDGQKMSKSRGNVVNPDDVVKEFGADSLRLFEMFMGPLEDTKPWSTRGVEGVHRFLNRAWRMMVDEAGNVLPSIKDVPMTSEQERVLHQTIQKVTDDVDTLNFNTAISQMMIFVNEFLNAEPKPRKAMETFVLLLSPFAPHVSEELWEKLGHNASIAYESWPKFDESKTKVDTVEMVVQVNGKVRSKFNIPVNMEEEEVKELVMADETIKRYVDGKQIVKMVVVKNKLVSLVIK